MINSADNSLKTANFLNLTNGSVSVIDSVGSSDLDDFYTFNLSSRSSFSLTINGLTADADTEIIRDINSNGLVDAGEVISRSARSGLQAETINTILDTGNYFIRVYRYSGNTSYNLNLSAIAFTTTISDNAGNTLNTARGIILGSTTSNYSDWVGVTDTDDYYRFTLTQASNLNLLTQMIIIDLPSIKGAI